VDAKMKRRQVDCFRFQKIVQHDDPFFSVMATVPTVPGTIVVSPLL
jgi:hypothetical protein